MRRPKQMHINNKMKPAHGQTAGAKLNSRVSNVLVTDDLLQAIIWQQNASATDELRDFFL